MNSNTERKLFYSIGLLLSTKKRNFESMREVLGISGDTVSRLLKEYPTTIQDLVSLVEKHLKKTRFILIDDTLIAKIYSKCIPQTSDNFDSSKNTVYRSLCSIVAMITDGDLTIAIDQTFWTSKEFNQTTYQRKWESAKKLVAKIVTYLPGITLVADGLYAVREFLLWLSSQKIKYVMRFHANRKLTLFDGQQIQIQKCEKLKCSNKKSARTIKAHWGELEAYFTAQLRTNKLEKTTTVYQVSNLQVCARQHVRIYGYRWNIEKFFRTAKQSLGLNDCQARKNNFQEKHIFAVFFIYAFLQIEKKRRRLKNVEEVIKILKRKNLQYLIGRIASSTQNFHVV